jgi:hypothetical protein
MQRALRMAIRVSAVVGLAVAHFATAPAAAQPRSTATTDAVGLQCRAACAAGPRDDRARLLACLQRCGVAVQQTTSQGRHGTRERRPQARLTQGSGLGRRVQALPTPNAPQDAIATAARAVAPGAARAAGGRAAPSWGAIYAAPAPFQGLGVVTGQRDRLAAHGRADSACSAGSGGRSCRMLIEFTTGCAAAARAQHGSRVSYTAAETGVTSDAAARAALNACQVRARDVACRVVQTVCAG